jgi:hypothetical protein
VLQPRYQQHRNGARSIREVILCDPAPDAAMISRSTLAAGGRRSSRLSALPR